MVTASRGHELSARSSASWPPAVTRGCRYGAPAPDDILGFVHAKDLLRLGTAERDEPVPLELIRKMLVVSSDRPVRGLMMIMRRARIHIALVLDDQGDVLGLVTLEDVLESLVGDIRDETDEV